MNMHKGKITLYNDKKVKYKIIKKFKDHNETWLLLYLYSGDLTALPKYISVYKTKNKSRFLYKVDNYYPIDSIKLRLAYYINDNSHIYLVKLGNIVMLED